MVLAGWWFVGLCSMAGCAGLLGIEDWQEPQNEGGAGGVGGDTGEGGDGAEGGGPVTPDAGMCGNGAQDGTETGVDCGGNTCAPCVDGFGCLIDADCRSGFCPPSRGYCVLNDGRDICGAEGLGGPSCADCIQNGGESDVDCGAECDPCRPGRKCTNDGECMSAHCNGGSCTKGDRGAKCYANEDCTSGSCGNTGCLTGNCCQ
jgi:hypothetical protein